MSDFASHPIEPREHCGIGGDCGECLFCRRAETERAFRSTDPVYQRECLSRLVKEAVRYGRATPLSVGS